MATALTALTLTGAALAAQVVLDFEGLKDQEDVLNFYNGGTGGAGSSGMNYGIAFLPNALALIDQDAGGTGLFENEPSPSTVMFWLNPGSAIANIAAGFETQFSFFYSSFSAASVTVHDGLDGTGTLLGTIALEAQHDRGCQGNYCNWTQATLQFSGRARSIDFSGAVNQTGYDNITFGPQTPGGVPEPASLALVGAALVGLGLTRRRRRA